MQTLFDHWNVALAVLVIVAPITWAVIHFLYRHRLESLKEELELLRTRSEREALAAPSEMADARGLSAAVPARREPAKRWRTGQPTAETTIEKGIYPDFMDVSAPEPEAERVFLPEGSPGEIFRALKKLPPLARSEAALHAYIGRWVRWSGVINSVTAEPELYVVFMTVDASDYVMLNFPKVQRPSVERLRDGQRVIVTGRIHKLEGGYVDVVHPQVEVQVSSQAEQPGR